MLRSKIFSSIFQHTVQLKCCIFSSPKAFCDFQKLQNGVCGLDSALDPDGELMTLNRLGRGYPSRAPEIPVPILQPINAFGISFSAPSRLVSMNPSEFFSCLWPSTCSNIENGFDIVEPAYRGHP